MAHLLVSKAKWALGLKADRMMKVKFAKQILDTEMTVVRN